jgi:hypothetical protein
MNPIVKQFILGQIDNAAQYVCANMPIDITSDEAYETLIGEAHVLDLFAKAAKYMAPADCIKYMPVEYCGQELRLLLRFKPTPKYNSYLWPIYPLQVNSESKLGRELALGVQVMTDWAKLRYVTAYVMNTWERADIASFFCSWLRSMDFDSINASGNLKAANLKSVMREIKIIKDRKLPSCFPSLTQGVRDICLSGNRLFGQYRMIHSTTDNTRFRENEAIPVSVARPQEIKMDEWLTTELEEIRSDWMFK